MNHLKKSIVVLVSGSGSNLQRIIDCINSGELPNVEISQVIADRDCFALQRAEENSIQNQLIKKGKTFCSELDKVIPSSTDLIVCAGFLSILTRDFCEKWNGKIINIHPSLLPKFGGKGMWGMNVHKAVLEAKEKQSGATVHFVTSGIDEGEIILQKSVEVSAGEAPESLAEKIHLVEYEIFPKAIHKVLSNK